MKFNDLAWAAVCFYYRSAGDRRYCAIMKDNDFLSRLRCMPQALSVKEFEEKAIDGFINMENYDLLVSHQLAEKILKKIIDLQLETFAMMGMTLLECNLNDRQIIEAITLTYTELRAYGLWITGASKIAHLLNDRHFPLLNPALARYFNITDDKTSIRNWLFRIQNDMQEVNAEFLAEGLEGSLEQFLSNRLGYTAEGCEKSLVKFIDEYYWLKYADCLTIPPRWAPGLIPSPNTQIH